MWGSISYIIIALQGLVYYTFIRFLKSTRFYKPYYKWIALVPFVLFSVTLIFIRNIFGRDYAPPDWFKYGLLYPTYIWMAATFFIGLWLLIGKLIKLPFQIPIWILKIFRPMREKLKALKERKPVKDVNLARRKFVRYATVGISTYAFSGAAYGMLRHDAYKIERKDIVIENLPQELKGTTITLVSDIHSGSYMSEGEIREYADIINSLGSDIICIPGDFINSDNREIPPVTKGLRDLKAKYGVYGTLGNHDFFSNNPDYVASSISNETPIQMLRNDHRKISINGKELYILGVDDTRGAGAEMSAVLNYYERTEQKLLASEADTIGKPKILLCHKPYGFDALAKKDIDLILSGHTHGGQVVPVKFGNFNLSFAATVSRYIEGLYKIGKSSMYVSRGIGTVAMPIRLNCPPEITVLKLV